ncbi:MAG: DUF4143 domain-containing protein [Candidatus Krumholzibacteriia bacterium]
MLGRDLPESAEGGFDLLGSQFRGGYPRIHDQDIPPQDWLANYTRTYVERDVQQVLRVLDLGDFRRFLGMCAARNGLIKNRLNRGFAPDLYFWRDSTGLEIDFLLENGDPLTPVEAKSATTMNREFLAGLQQWQKLGGQEEGPAAFVYGGDEGSKRSGIVVYPWACW